MKKVAFYKKATFFMVKMGFFEWHKRIVKRISERNFRIAFLGRALILFSLGSMFSMELVRYGYFILIVSAFILYYYVKKNFMNSLKNLKTEYKINVIGLIGLSLLFLFFGIQSPQMLFKKYILVLGIVAVLPALKQIITGK